MKQAITILFVVTILLWSPASFADGFTNLMGVSNGQEYGSWCIFGPGMQVYTAHVFIQNPENPDFDGGGIRPVTMINGFECRLVVTGDATLVGMHFPVDAIDAGTNGNTVVGFAEPVPVVDGYAIVATLEIFLLSPGGEPGELKSSPLPCDGATGFVYMFPTRPTSSIEGMLAYLDADDPDDPLVGAQTDLYPEEGLVMLLEPMPVATEQQTWGSIKSLYR